MQRKVHVGVIERFQESSSRGTIPLISFFIFSFCLSFLVFLSYTSSKTEVHFSLQWDGGDVERLYSEWYKGLA